jgi:adenine-specific DNA-methyltransferase
MQAIDFVEIPTIETLSPKLRGGYYTPKPIADFLAEWVIRDKQDRVLEPSCGDGSLVEAAAARLLRLGATSYEVNNQLRATELFESEASIARARLEKLYIDGASVVHTGDFFTAIGSERGLLFTQWEAPLHDSHFEAIIGNPPFIRSQNFPEEQRQRAFAEMERAGLHPNRLTNAWVPFLIASSQRLTKYGRLAMVIPAELLQVGYAGETRAYLSQYFASIKIITFKKLVFDDIQQEVVLLLAEKGDSIAHTIDIVELDDSNDLAALSDQITVSNAHKVLTESKDKWTLYFLSPCEIELIQQLANRTDIPRLGNFAKVEVGVVTGNNNFFVQTQSNLENRNLADFARPLVGRTAQLKGLIYSEIDHQLQQAADVGCWLLDVPATASVSSELSNYIRSGERDNVHTGYKCRIRPVWYSVPSTWVPDAFMFRQIYKFPKLVANATGATSTDTVHRVRLLKAVDAKQLAASFYNVLTFAFSEVLGRSYGGGVLEIEPGEAGHLPIPFSAELQLDVEAIDALERDGKSKEILTITSKLMQEKFGIDLADCRRLEAIWQKLSARRINRKATPKKGQ